MRLFLLACVAAGAGRLQKSTTAITRTTANGVDTLYSKARWSTAWRVSSAWPAAAASATTWCWTRPAS
jgi:hypothetical protein